MNYFPTEQKLAESYAAKQGYDRAYLRYVMGGVPIFHCTCNLNGSHKLGLPCLVRVKDGRVRRLDDVTVRYVMHESSK